MRYFLLGTLGILLVLLAGLGSAQSGAPPFPPEGGEIGNYEISLADLGYDDFTVAGANQEGCTDISFTQGSMVLRFPVLSLHFQAAPAGVNIAESEAAAELFLDGNSTAFREILPEEIAKNWVRIDIPRKETGGEVTQVRLCIHTSRTITGLTLRNDSTYGEYFKADFSNPLGFRKTIAHQRAAVGEEFEITVRLENAGSEGKEVRILHRRPELEDSLPFVTILRGDTHFEGVVPACQEWGEKGCEVPGVVSFSYVAKSSRATKLTLLPAVLEYTNVFGEEVEQESTRESIYITEPGLKLKPVLLSDAELLQPGEKTDVTLTVKNEGADTIYNTAVFIENSDGLQVEGRKLYSIVALPPGESERFPVTVSGSQPGRYSVGCKLIYLDLADMEVQCQPLGIEVSEPGIREEIIVAAILLILGIGVYVFIATRK